MRPEEDGIKNKNQSLALLSSVSINLIELLYAYGDHLLDASAFTSIRPYLPKSGIYFSVSVDFLLGEGLNAAYDKEMIKRLDEAESLPEDEKQRIFDYMDLIIRDYKTKKNYK